MSGFWGLVMQNGRRYMQKVETGFCISMAVLDAPNPSNTTEKHSEKPVRLYAEREKMKILLCTLNAKTTPQVQLRVKFGKGETVALTFEGSPNHKLHLSGYTYADNDVTHTLPFQGLQQSILVSEPKSSDKSKDSVKKRVSIKESPFATKEASSDEDNSDDEDDDDDEDEDIDLSAVLSNGASELSKKSVRALQAELDAMASDDDDDEDDSDDDEDESDESDDKVPKLQNSAGQDEDEDDDEDEDEDDDDSEDEAMKEMSKANANKKANSPQKTTPKSQSQADKQASSTGKPQSQSTPLPNKSKAEMRTPENQNIKLKQPSSAGHTPMRIFNKGGIVIQDTKQGDGQAAKSGKMVSVYYVGRLKHGNKKFDSCESGQPFKFRLGKGEVIKGWDVGIEGMKINGKRRLTIPAQMAYGKRGCPPAIPPNSTLVFEVELKGVS